MRINIFNVGHGSAALVTGKGKYPDRFLVDCAFNTSTGFRPSAYLRKQGLAPVTIFFNNNMDQDHLSDFVLCRVAGYSSMVYNFSVSPLYLQTLKQENGPLTFAMKSFIGSMTGCPVSFPQTQTVNWACFWNKYPVFTETNDLSMVTFLEEDGICIAFPGDLPKAAWRQLLLDQGFRTWLSRVNVFVAPHHGRLDGYCEEVFGEQLCRPHVIIVSDGKMQFETQEVDYSQHARGIWIDGERHFKLTTRTLGHITIDSGPSGLRIFTEKGLPQKRSALALALLANKSRPAPLPAIGAKGLLAHAMSTPPPAPPMGAKGLLARAMSTPPPAPMTGLMSLATPPPSAFDLLQTPPPQPFLGLMDALDRLQRAPQPALRGTGLINTPRRAFDLTPLSPPPTPPSLESSILAELIRRRGDKNRL